MSIWAIMIGFMAKKHKLWTARKLQIMSVGTLCALGAFAMGIETAGDVQPFAHSEAALQEIIQGGKGLRGDVDGNGKVDTEDAYLLYQFSEHLESPSADEIRRGDTDGDGQLTAKDLGFVLHTISVQ